MTLRKNISKEIPDIDARFYRDSLHVTDIDDLADYLRNIIIVAGMVIAFGHSFNECRVISLIITTKKR